MAGSRLKPLTVKEIEKLAAVAPNRKWAGNITYIWTSEDWLYLAVILDLHSRRHSYLGGISPLAFEAKVA